MRLNRKFRAFTPILPHLTHIARTHVSAFIKIKVLQIPYKSSTCLIVVARWSRNPWDKFRKEATNSCHPSGKQQSSNDMVMGWKRERLGKERELYIFKNGIFRQILIRFPGFLIQLFVCSRKNMYLCGQFQIECQRYFYTTYGKSTFGRGSHKPLPMGSPLKSSP